MKGRQEGASTIRADICWCGVKEVKDGKAEKEKSFSCMLKLLAAVSAGASRQEDLGANSRSRTLLHVLSSLGLRCCFEPFS